MVAERAPRLIGGDIRKSHKEGLFVIGAVAWIVCPLLVIGLVVLSNQRAEFAEQEHAWAPAEVATEELSAPVGLALLWGENEKLYAPAWSGTVQKTWLTPGAKVSSGDVVAVVDGVSRIAWHGSSVFYRSLSAGQTGADVLLLKELLAFRGEPQTGTDTVDQPAVRGMLALAKELGAFQPDEHVHFDPAWVVHMASETFEVEISYTFEGAPVPASGETLASGVQHLLEVALVDPEADVGVLDGEDGRGAGLAPLEYARVVDRSGLVAEESDRIELAGEVLALDESRAGLSSDVVKTVEKYASRGAPLVLGRIFVAGQDGGYSIPAAALSSSPQPTICVRRDGRAVKMSVEVVSSSASGTVVSGPLMDSDKVRVPGPTGGNPCLSP